MEQENQLIVFKVADQDYALSILETREIIRLAPVTSLPSVPDYLKGVINLRGQIVPVVDLRLKLGLPPAEVTKEAKIIVIEQNQRQVGLIVNRVSGVGSYEENEFEPFAPEEENGANALRGIVRKADALWLLLNTEALTKIEPLQTAAGGMPSAALNVAATA